MIDHLPRSILVVDDDEGMRSSLRDILELDGYHVQMAENLGDMFSPRDWSDFLAVLLDRKLPDGMGEESLPRLRQMAPDTAVIVITAFSDLGGAVAALRDGATDYIVKPIHPEALRASLVRVLEQRRLAMEKGRSETAFRKLVEAAQSLILILGPGHRVDYICPYAEELTGYPASAIEGRNFVEQFVPAADRTMFLTRLEEATAARQVRPFEHRLLRKDGRPLWLVWNARRIVDSSGETSILAVGQDVTELKEAQHRALQAERLAAIGQMVTGLAHESRNALQRSQACLGMLAKRVGGQVELLELIAGVQEAQYDLSRLYESVRSYAAPLNLRLQTANLSAILREAWSNLQSDRQTPRGELSEHGESIELTCEVDPFTIGQVLRNILENALSVCSEPVRIDARYSAAEIDGCPAVELAVRDYGPGLTDEQQRRIFEPFFTTKTHGTGLGMAIARRIVEAHRGQLKAVRPTGPGTEIRVLLPRRAEPCGR